MVSSLAKSPYEILKSLDEHKCHILHMLDGIGDEWFEVEEEMHNFHRHADEMKAVGSAPCNKRCIKELGDLLFYVEGLVLLCPIAALEEFLSEPRQLMPAITAMKNAFEFGKRYIFYDQPPNLQQLAQAHLNLIPYISMSAASIGATIDEVREANYAKLAGKGGRHEGGYSDAKAVARVDTKVNPDPLGADAIKEKEQDKREELLEEMKDHHRHQE